VELVPLQLDQIAVAVGSNSFAAAIRLRRLQRFIAVAVGGNSLSSQQRCLLRHNQS
jgi:hypothetical protein